MYSAFLISHLHMVLVFFQYFHGKKKERYNHLLNYASFLSKQKLSPSGSCGTPPAAWYCNWWSWIGRLIFSLSSLQDCPPEAGDFRAQQCSAHNDVKYQGQLYEWLPVSNDPDNPCSLKCQARGTALVVELAPKVLDGTRCYTESLDMCISGLCQVRKEVLPQPLSSWLPSSDLSPMLTPSPPPCLCDFRVFILLICFQTSFTVLFWGFFGGGGGGRGRHI